jgi:hypothetical protein
MTDSTERRQASRDRRQARRAQLTAAVAAKRVRGPARLAQAANIGASGMTLRYAADGSVYLPRTTIALAFQIPGQEQVIRVRGEVVFDRADGPYRTAGVRLGRLGARDAAAIARFVDSPALG